MKGSVLAGGGGERHFSQGEEQVAGAEGAEAVHSGEERGPGRGEGGGRAGCRSPRDSVEQVLEAGAVGGHQSGEDSFEGAEAELGIPPSGLKHVELEAASKEPARMATKLQEEDRERQRRIGSAPLGAVLLPRAQQANSEFGGGEAAKAHARAADIANSPSPSSVAAGPAVALQLPSALHRPCPSDDSLPVRPSSIVEAAAVDAIEDGSEQQEGLAHANRV